MPPERGGLDDESGGIDAPSSGSKKGGGYSLVVSAKDTNYGKSKAYMAPPSKMIRVYPDNTESDLWFNYEERSLYYPVCIFKDGKRVENHLSNVWVTMHVSEKIRGNAAPPASSRAQAQRGVYWFKAIKAYVFGEIEIKFEVLDERTYVNPGRRITTDPLTFVSTVDVDEFGHSKPTQPENAGDTVVDYVYDIDPRMARTSRTYVQQNHNQSSYRPAGQGVSRNGVGEKRRATSSSSSSSGARELSEYERKTLYADSFLRPPRRSYKFTLEDEKKSIKKEKRRRTTGAGGDSMYTEGDDEEGTLAESSSTVGGDSEREDEVVPNMPRGPGSRLGLDHALFDPRDLGGTGVEARGGQSTANQFQGEYYKAAFPNGRSSSGASNYGNSGRYERLLASICNLLDTDKTTKGGDMAQHLLDQLEEAQGSLPESYGADEGDGYGGGLVNIGQLRELLAARRSLDDAIKVVLMQGGRAIERPS